jgi:hypothetical protein
MNGIGPRNTWLIVLMICFVGPALKVPELRAQVPAFPSAQGYGKYSIGGRGGEVIQVTNLNDSGEGSLREACRATGPRTIVFRVAGTIELSSTINIPSPYVTIAGQTAPGDGICLRHAGNTGFGSTLINVSTHDVIIRFIRLRRGPGAEGECCGDCLGISKSDQDVYNVIVDHCSMSWSTDEITGTWYTTHDVTYQSCIFSEALYFSSHQDEGMPDGELQAHSMGPLFGDRSTGVTLYLNLMAHNADRNPFANTGTPGFTASYQVVNNVVYNWIYFGSKFGQADGGLTQANFIGNYLRAGPDTRTVRYEMLVLGTPQNAQVYVSGNIGHHRLTDDDPSTEWDIAGIDMINPAPADYRAPSPFSQPEIATLTASQAYDSVLDERIVSDVMDNGPFVSRILGNGKSYYGLIDDPSQVGGWPEYLGVDPYPDEDGDGMSDDWERLSGLDPGDAGDRNGDHDGNGYTNLEEFLNMGSPDGLMPSGALIPDEPTWQVYPNPAGDYLFIESRGSNTARLIQVLDMHGRILMTSIPDATSRTGLYTGVLPSGMYVLRVNNSSKGVDHIKIFKK